jgi:hypothetical protein
MRWPCGVEAFIWLKQYGNAILCQKPGFPDPVIFILEEIHEVPIDVARAACFGRRPHGGLFQHPRFD